MSHKNKRFMSAVLVISMGSLSYLFVSMMNYMPVYDTRAAMYEPIDRLEDRGTGETENEDRRPLDQLEDTSVKTRTRASGVDERDSLDQTLSAEQIEIHQPNLAASIKRYDPMTKFALKDLGHCKWTVPIRIKPGCKRLTWFAQPQPLTALASFPGSGNTWVRHLLQEATGIVTGSVYCSTILRGANFPAEGMVNNSVLVVKTHRISYKDQTIFDRALVILRHPLDAILAEFNRRHSNKTSYPPQQIYKAEWSAFVKEHMVKWTSFHSAWMQFHGPLFVVHYEYLRNNTIEEIRKILNFLNMKASDEDYACMAKNSEGIFHRKSGEFKFYTCTYLTDDDCGNIDAMWSDTMQSFQDRVRQRLFN